MRGREFIMKDAYSFDKDADSEAQLRQNVQRLHGDFHPFGFEFPRGGGG